METWRSATGYEGFYEVSDEGRVRSLHRGKMRMLRPGSANGYPMVILQVGGVRAKRYIHRLVAETFIGPCPEGQQVRHRDDNRLNPALSNLLYGTPADNNYDAVANGVHYWANRTHCDKGHEYTEESSYWNGKQRVCRPCRATRVAEWNKRNPDYQAAAKRKKRGRRGEWRAATTHCGNGHEYTPENTIRTKGGTRRCRECKNADARRSRASTKKDNFDHSATP